MVEILSPFIFLFIYTVILFLIN
uniref:Uncharacterized protein n=1 Tax=Anguilla anguilla TaxID=7936 RepID=A0A0E9WA35_ANGAN